MHENPTDAISNSNLAIHKVKTSVQNSKNEPKMRGIGKFKATLLKSYNTLTNPSLWTDREPKRAGLQLRAGNNRWAGFCHTRLLRANLGGQHPTVPTKAASAAHAPEQTAVKQALSDKPSLVRPTVRYFQFK